MNIQKAAVRASNNAMRGYIPHNAIVSQGAKIAARQQAQEKPQRGKKGRKRERLTEISTGSGKPVLKQNVGVVRAAKKLFEYEETGLAPYEVRALIEREKALTETVKKCRTGERRCRHEPGKVYHMRKDAAGGRAGDMR